VDLLKSSKLGQVFDNTSASYKFYWLLGILDLLPSHPDGKIPLPLIQAQMVARALPTVAYFRINLGKQDRLQDLVHELVNIKGVGPETNLAKAAVAALGLGSKLSMLGEMVPSRFLSVWAGPRPGIKGAKLTASIEEHAIRSQSGDEPTPYCIFGEYIQVGEAWRAFLLENRVAIEDYAKLRLVGFLESRNLHAQNISRKLEAPTVRDLTEARKFWSRTLELNRGSLKNIYLGRSLEEPFEVDHFIPYSFEASDLLWNLIPTDKASNIRKSDKLPDLDRYLNDYAEAHRLGITAHAKEHGAFGDHCTALEVAPEQLIDMSAAELSRRLHTLFAPRIVYARNCGFVAA
jgi:hypothetical protein